MSDANLIYRPQDFKKAQASRPKSADQQAFATDGEPQRQAGRINRVLLIAGVGAAILSVGLALALNDRPGESVLLGLMAILAFTGVFALFGLGLGWLRFTSDEPGEDMLTGLCADQASTGLVLTRRDGTVIYANPAYLALTGGETVGTTGLAEPASAAEKPKASLFVRSPHFIASGEEADAPLWRLAQAGAAGRTHCELLSLPPRHGAACEAITTQTGQARRYQVSVRPCPPTRQSRIPLVLWEFTPAPAQELPAASPEDASLHGDATLAQAMQAAPVAMMLSNEQGLIMQANETLAEWTGLSPDRSSQADAPALEEILFLEGWDWPSPSAMAEEAPDGAEVVAGPGYLQSREGTNIPVWVSLSPTSAGGYSAIALRRDKPGICPELNAATAPHLGETFRHAPIAVAMLDEQGGIVSHNPTFRRMFLAGHHGAQAKGAGLFRLIDKSARKSVRKALAKAVSRGRGMTGRRMAGKRLGAPVEIVFSGDRKRVGRLYLAPLEHKGAEHEAGAKRTKDISAGQPVAVAYAIDISEQRALEEQFSQSQKMQAIGQLAGGIAHDFNNMLTAIIGFSDLLLASHRQSDPSFQDIMNIKNSANRAASLVKQLLAFSSRQTLRPQVLSLTDVVEEFAAMIGRLVGEKIEAKVIHGRDLWFVKADSSQLLQVVLNLAVNARDAMADGGRLTIRTANVSERDSLRLADSGVEPGEYVLLEVSDSGCGMPPEVLEKIFEPFFSTKEVGKGTGLGLSTVYGIIKQTGGYIVPKSTVGEGTIFRIYLPRYVPEEHDIESVDAAAGRQEKPRDVTGSGTILLVEDEEMVRNFAARTLATRGYRVLQATTGVEALDLMAEHDGEVDLVISDVVMPEMDGPTLLKQLRKSRPDLKIIFISGYAEEAFRNNLDENEHFVFLPKPFTLKKLSEAVKEMLA